MCVCMYKHVLFHHPNVFFLLVHIPIEKKKTIIKFRVKTKTSEQLSFAKMLTDSLFVIQLMQLERAKHQSNIQQTRKKFINLQVLWSEQPFQVRIFYTCAVVQLLNMNEMFMWMLLLCFLMGKPDRYSTLNEYIYICKIYVRMLAGWFDGGWRVVAGKLFKGMKEMKLKMCICCSIVGIYRRFTKINLSQSFAIA